MKLEFDLIENALHSLNEALLYYNNEYEDKYKFCIIHINHCVELLLKEILVRHHPAFICEDIDKFSHNNLDEVQTIGYALALKRVHRICNIDFQQYEDYISELGRIRNRIQHYKCSIDSMYLKDLILKSFSAVEYIINDILRIDLCDYDEVIDDFEITSLHEDADALNRRKQDIVAEFNNNKAVRYKIEYDKDKYLYPPCPICGMRLLADDYGIRCKMCNAEFDDYKNLCEFDGANITSKYICRELGKRKHLMNIYECPNCDNKAVVYQDSIGGWSCLCCGEEYGETTYCNDCGSEMPFNEKISSLAMSDIDTEDYFYLCPECASKAKHSEDYIGYEIN